MTVTMSMTPFETPGRSGPLVNRQPCSSPISSVGKSINLSIRADPVVALRIFRTVQQMLPPCYRLCAAASVMITVQPLKWQDLYPSSRCESIGSFQSNAPVTQKSQSTISFGPAAAISDAYASLS